MSYIASASVRTSLRSFCIRHQIQTLVLATLKSPKGNPSAKTWKRRSDIFSVASVLQISAPLILLRYVRAQRLHFILRGIQQKLHMLYPVLQRFSLAASLCVLICYGGSDISLCLCPQGLDPVLCFQKLLLKRSVSENPLSDSRHRIDILLYLLRSCMSATDARLWGSLEARCTTCDAKGSVLILSFSTSND